MKRIRKKKTPEYRVQFLAKASGTYLDHYASADEQMARAIAFDLKRAGQAGRLLAPDGTALETWEGKGTTC